MMKSGDLRHRITLQNPVRTQNTSTGAITLSWEDVVTVWASIKPLSTREFLAAQAAQSKVVGRIVIRYRAGVDATLRAVHNGKIYNIEGVMADADSGLEYLTLTVSEGVQK
jgi:SPP1 family predicted phage head-tail adaptor